MSITQLPSKTSRSDCRGGSRAAPSSIQKGQQTKAAIVDAALGLAAQIGLEGLSIGALADVMHMSKSGVFAHFGSREELQISVICEYFTRFEEEVFFPALKEPRGLPRVRALFANWMKRVALSFNRAASLSAVLLSSMTGLARYATRWPRPCKPGWLR